jgi:hypothetical protein
MILVNRLLCHDISVNGSPTRLQSSYCLASFGTGFPWEQLLDCFCFCIFSISLGEGQEMSRFTTIGILLVAVAGSALASTHGFAFVASPEIDASAGAAGIALISGGFMVLRERRKK